MKKESITSSILKNSFWNFLMVLTAKIGGLIFTILLARFLLPERFGIYNLAMSITLILLTFADTGINQTLIRFFSEALNKNKKELALARCRYIFKLKLLISLSFVFGLLIFSYPISIYIFKKPDLIFPILFSSIYLLVFSLESFYESFFYVIKKVRYLTIKQMLWEILRIIGILFVFLVVASQYYILGVIGVLIFSMFLALIFLLYHLKKIFPVLFYPIKTDLEREDKKRINKFLALLTFGGALTMIFGYIDIIMIGIFLSSEYVGYYSAAFAFIGGLSSLITIANILLPLFTTLKKQQLDEALERVTKYTFLLALPMTFGLLCLGKLIIQAVYGREYLPSFFPFIFLAFLIVETPITTTLKSLLSAKEKLKPFVGILVTSTLMNIVLNYILIISLLKTSPIWATSGAAIATLISRYFYFFSLSFYMGKKLKIPLRYLQAIKPLVASIIMFFVIIWINSKIKYMNLVFGLIEVFLGVLIYFSVMLIIKGIKKEDFLLIKELLG